MTQLFLVDWPVLPPPAAISAGLYVWRSFPGAVVVALFAILAALGLRLPAAVADLPVADAHAMVDYVLSAESGLVAQLLVAEQTETI